MVIEKWGLHGIELYFFDKLEPITCRALLEPLGCQSGKLMVQVAVDEER